MGHWAEDGKAAVGRRQQEGVAQGWSWGGVGVIVAVRNIGEAGAGAEEDAVIIV